MEQPKENKKLEPSSNKKVRIKFRPGRGAEGVIMDKDGYAMVDEAYAQELVNTKYADLAEEK